MAAFFERILQVSLSGSVIVLAVLVLRMLLRNAPRRTMCLLWMLAVLRLLVPFEIQSQWSLQPKKVEFVPPAVQEDYFDSGPIHGTVPPEFLEDAVEYPLDPAPAPVKQTDPMAPFALVWLMGVAALSIHGAASYWRLKRRVRGAVIQEEGVWICPGLDTAFVLGFLRPRIYLPVLEGAERELVLRHERCHIRRLDPWWKLLAYAAVSVHWFNPLAWVTYVLMCRDMELACDQETVKGMDNATRKAYSAALLNCAARRSGIAVCPVAFGEISVKERIKMVLNYRKPGFWVTVVALIAAIAVGFFLLTSPKELTDLEKCEQALEKWQGMESIHLRISSVNEGDLALNSWMEKEYWASKGDAIQRETFDNQDSFCIWRALLDGKVYISFNWEEDGETVFGNWEEDPDSQQWDIPWIIKQDWTTWQFTHVRTVQTQAGTDIHLEAYRPGYGTFPMVFSFEGKELKQVQRTITDMMVEEREEDGILAVYSVQTFILEETDREGIEKQMKLNGPVPELVSLYRELDALQAAENVHFVYDTEKDNVYGGWDTRHQEFLKWGNTWYWDSDMLSEYGEIYIKYLWYGAKMHKWAHSNTHGAPQHRWKKVEDRLELPHLLTKDWRALQVLNIQEADGSTIITIQGDPTDTETMTYYSLTYQFYLDQDGKLTKMVANHHVNEYIQQVGNVDTKAISTATILDTSDAEIQDRVQTVWAEVKEALD